MLICGVICEYNPFHNGHKRQFDRIRQQFGPDTAIVCLMSGNYVQRGMPAIFDKSSRARAAVACGADLVLELPIPFALSSAEGFAAGGVSLLSPFCDILSFGSESGDSEKIRSTAQALLDPAFPEALRRRLDTGISFPAARQQALSDMGADASLLTSPNDILAVEYTKAILRTGSSMEIFPITRNGSYHDSTPDPDAPSATSVRLLMESGGDYAPFLPDAAFSCFRNAPVHTLQAGERAVLARLRTLSDREFEALPFGSEGLWRKLMHSVREEVSLANIAESTKSKRYTRTRIDRCILCAFLGITREDLAHPQVYSRVLALNDRGRKVLNRARKALFLPNAGERADHPYAALENRAGALYGLFAQGAAEPPDLEARRRVFCFSDAKSN